ncbi:MAG: hypothetical protein FJZ58_03435, partial [Chlamydiae bacterium]|nr:hypothetical protein [Chlamydiota bacterium]
MANHPFSDKDYAWGQACLLQGRVKSLVFSQGTYQAEIIDQKASFWPVLSLDDRGQVLDAICSCSHEGNCPHEAACYLAIFQGKEEPLHRRFAKSFWHQLGSTLRKKWGVRVDLLVREEGWKAYSSEGDLLFAIHPRTQEGKDLLQELIENRLVETEETSLKFSNLSEEELLLWRQGRPSEALSYELSFWADLAKWFFIQQEQGVAYELFFLPV